MSEVPNSAYSVKRLSLEEQFLLFAVRKGIRGDRLVEDDLRGVFEALDWSLVVKIAFENRVASLLSFALSTVSESGVVPQSESAILKKFYLETAQKNMRIKHSLKRILGALETKGIDAITLKGVALAYSIWPTVATRQMHDIDLVVLPEDVEETVEVLLASGYIRPGPYSLDWHLAYTKELSHFVDPASGIEVDLHFRFFTPNPLLKIEEASFWRNASHREFGGMSARSLAPQELLIYLCMHVSVGHFLGDNMRSLLDIALLMEQAENEFDPEVFREYLEHEYVGPLVAFPVVLCARYLGVNFDRLLPQAEDALGLHYKGFKRRVLERAAWSFLFRIEPKGFSDWVLVRMSKKIIYEPQSGPLDLILCFFLSQPSITDNRDQGGGWHRMLATFKHRTRVMGRLLKDLFSRSEKSRES